MSKAPTALKYANLLQQSQQEKDNQELEFQVEAAKQQLEADILATKRELAIENKKLLEAKSSRTFNSQKIIDVQIKIEGLQDGLARLNNLLAELF